MFSTLQAVASRATIGDWLFLSVSILFLLWLLGTWSYDFFRKRGVASTRPWTPFLGDTVPAFLGTKALADLVKDLYADGKGHSVFGIFEFSKPIFMIRDPELLKIVAVKDFDKFVNHRSLTNENSDPLFGKNLFNLKDQRWRDMRSTLSPAFTTSKIKGMFPLVTQCCQQVVDHLHEKYQGSKMQPLEVDMKDLFSRMANDVIATVAFGLCCDSFKVPTNQFYHMGKVLTNFSFTATITILMNIISPKLAQFLKLSILSKKSTSYFDSLVRETVLERQKRGIFRPDMLQLLMQARQGQLKADAGDKHEEEMLSTSTSNMTDEDVSAQAIIFFLAGFDTVSTALCFTTYALSHNPEAQTRLQEEVDEVMKRTGSKPKYEDVQGMKYLDAVINETLRLYSPAVAGDRQCLEDTVLPPTEHSGPTTIRKGDILWIPILGLHHDPEYWPEPQRFDPERFSDENKHNIKPFTFLPFGMGPRICIGQRLALIEVKLAILYLVANFELSPSPKTKHPMKFEKGFNIKIQGGFWTVMKPRNHE